MMRFPLAAASVLLVFAGHTAALGDRATTLVDELETAMQDRLAAENLLPEPDRKVVKALTKGLKKLARDTTTGAGDLKLFKGVVGLLTKHLAADEAITAAVDATTLAADDGVVDVIDAARALIDGAEDGTGKTRADKAAVLALALLEASREKTPVKSRVAALYKARKKADGALAQGTKLLPAGGDDVLPESHAYFVAYVGFDDYRLIDVLFPAGTISTIPTGTGPVSISRPVPRASPDGTIVAFEQDAHMVLTDLTGEPAVIQVGVEADWDLLAWSPNSMLLAASGQDPDVLTVFDREGNTVHTLDVHPLPGLYLFPNEYVLEGFQWSYDSRYLAYLARVGENASFHLYSLDVTTGDVAELSTFGDTIRHFAWSPVANRIAYAANEDTGDPEGELHIVNADGTEKVTGSPPGENVERAGARVTIQWGVNGERVLYETKFVGGQGVASVLADGTRHVTLATGTVLTQFEPQPMKADPPGAGLPVVTGDGCAFIIDGILMVGNQDGTDLGEVDQECANFGWREDGAACAYAAKKDESTVTAIYACDADGGTVTQMSPDLVPEAGAYSEYKWTRASGSTELTLDYELMMAMRDSSGGKPGQYCREFPELNGGSATDPQELVQMVQAAEVKYFRNSTVVTKDASYEVKDIVFKDSDKWLMCRTYVYVIYYDGLGEDRIRVATCVEIGTGAVEALEFQY